MHLLAARPISLSGEDEAVDLGQTPGDIVVLSAADGELNCLARARSQLPKKNFPSLRLASLLHLGHNMSVDVYVDGVISNARLVVVRLLGGRGYWPYGVEQITARCRKKKIPVAFLPGDDRADADLREATTLSGPEADRLWRYLIYGGMENAGNFLKYAANLLGEGGDDWDEPTCLARAGLYAVRKENPEIKSIRSRWQKDRPLAAVVFYQALVQSGNVKAVNALIKSLERAHLNVLPVFISSLRDDFSVAALRRIFALDPPDVSLNATGFAAPLNAQEKLFSTLNCPVLQVIFSGGDKEDWREGSHGLAAKDIAMNIALPEMDGRIISRAVSFKKLERRDKQSETDIVVYEPVPDRMNFVAALAANWARLRQTKPSKRRIALILANYPNRDGRIGNGVGLDTPQSVIEVLRALKDAGYDVSDIPENGDDLISRLSCGPTNDFKALGQREIRETFSLAEYRAFFDGLAEDARNKVTKRWGQPEDDPHFIAGEKGGAFALSVFRCGNVLVSVQPARGYNIDPTKTYHDPDLAPPHGYLAFYAWILRAFDAHAVVHMGKHGNLEWLPGKALALSKGCFPEAAFGPVPHLYPFIVNDPGEGTQAKRRTSAVIVDHMTPPLTRAESYGPLRDLEVLVDEYYAAAGLDPRRIKVLKKEILSLCRVSGLDEDCGIKKDEDDDAALGKLDNYLCELKELQIRDGLHIFGQSPKGGQLNDLLVALVRIPRGDAKKDASLLAALADDLGLSFDPLDCKMADTWQGVRPEVLDGGDRWRSYGDTVERLENLSLALVSKTKKSDPAWAKTQLVLDEVEATIRPAVSACGSAEIDGLLCGLDGGFVAPGPSGAPTRGRPDVLPTGRNFFSVDTRTVPTPAAWHLGWKSATLLIERYVQDVGAWPKTMALSAWGTSNMRTGGDDIAQGLALMGVRPTWDSASRRVNGFEIMPLGVLDRPRIDVTLRISGFFRDAFPGLIDLFDQAARAVAMLDEEECDNPMAANVKREAEKLALDGMPEKGAADQAAYRVFGSMPGAYGAGLQALMDEKGWEKDADLAEAYVAWGGYAYGKKTQGVEAKGLFEARLKEVQAVIQNQDNREHDLLDSDDYYQFEGGLTAAVRHLSKSAPQVYHNDHSRPATPKVRTLEEEIGRIVRGRVVNPKWIKGVMRHGYKGAFEMAATVDYLFAFAATAHCVKDHHFDAVFDAYINDEDVREFLQSHNPAALAEMAARLLEAQERELWRPRMNSTFAVLSGLIDKEDAKTDG
jgi:cobaltochelatase CobN